MLLCNLSGKHSDQSIKNLHCITGYQINGVKMINLLYLSCGSGVNSLLFEAAKMLREESCSINVIQYSSEDMDKNEEIFSHVLNQVPSTDFVIIDLHGSVPYFKKFTRLQEKIKTGKTPVFLFSSIDEEMAEYRSWFPFSNDDYHQVFSYLHLGGLENMRSLLLWVYVQTGGGYQNVPKPVRPPTHGIYHPGCHPGIQISEYRMFLPKTTMKAGILFWQNQYLSKSLEAVDMVITSLEYEGLDTIPVYCSSAPDKISGSPGIAEIIRHYFMDGEKTTIDVLLIMMGFSQLSFSAPGSGETNMVTDNFFSLLGVPVLQLITTNQGCEEWNNNIAGLSILEISSHVVWPEYDGQIITVPVACHEQAEKTRKIRGINERIQKVAKMAKSWAELRITPVHERRVALILYQYGLANDCIGGAFGLDTPESVVKILHAMKDAGYDCGEELPASGQELIQQLLSSLTNTPECMDEEELKRRSVDLVSTKEYLTWLSKIPKGCSQKIIHDWGEPPGTILTAGKEVLIPGKLFGNIFIGLQPPRGFLEEADAVYHSNDIVMPHQYLAFYQWIKEKFKAQAIIHMGTHGTLEWLPGKGVGLSSECYPDITLGDLPHLYPYIIDNPGEGIQAKRRSSAVILDHLIPAMTRAGGYGKLEELTIYIQDYFRSEKNRDNAKALEILKEIAQLVEETNLSSDLQISLSDQENLAASLELIYDYLCTARDSLIKDGLHIYGFSPEGERFCEMLYALTRMKNGSMPSLRESVGKSMGLILSKLQENPSGWNELFQKPNGALIDDIDKISFDIIRSIVATGCDPEKIPVITQDLYNNSELNETLIRICKTIVPDLRQTTDEMNNLLSGLNGGYVPPGPSGPPTRGNAHILPTGRNFYSIDPAIIPTPAAFAIGKKMADQMIERYVRDEGVYPENVGIVIFATDSMKTGGDDIAYLLWLMGLRPVWSSYGGRVTGLEIIPLSELNRPRIDVTLRITGLFRDVFPGLVELIDEGVEMVATLDESDQENYLASHLRKSLLESLKNGMDPDEARSRALVRIFGCPPGTYGAGVADKIITSGWEERQDLADTYIDWGGHAYGRKYKGEAMKDLFRTLLSRLDVTVKNHNSRELDILDNDDDFMYHGGMIAVTKAYGDKDPVSFVGDSSDPDKPVLRTVEEESKFLFRSRIENPKWLLGLKPHRYRGAQELTSLFDFAFGWDATADVLEKWQYQSLAETFLFDKACREWLSEDNPYALQHMAGRLLEAVDRGMWNPDEETLSLLQSIYLSVESNLESLTDPKSRISTKDI